MNDGRLWWYSTWLPSEDAAHEVARRMPGPSGELHVNVIDPRASYCQALAPEAAFRLAALLRIALESVDRLSDDDRATGVALLEDLEDLEDWLSEEYVPDDDLD